MITEAVREILLKDLRDYITTNRKINPVPKVEDLDGLIANEANVTTKTALLLFKQCHNKTMHPTHFFQTLRHTLDEYNGGALAGVKGFFGYERSHLKSTLNQTLISAEKSHQDTMRVVLESPEYKITNDRIFHIACKLARRDLQLSYMTEKLEFSDKCYELSNGLFPSDYICGGTLRYSSLKAIKSTLVLTFLEGYIAAHEVAYPQTQGTKRDDLAVYLAFESNAKRDFEDKFVATFDPINAVLLADQTLPKKVTLTEDIKEFMQCELITLSCREALKTKIRAAHSSNVANYLQSKNADLRSQLTSTKKEAVVLHGRNEALSHELELILTQSKIVHGTEEEPEEERSLSPNGHN